MQRRQKKQIHNQGAKESSMAGKNVLFLPVKSELWWESKWPIRFELNDIDDEVYMWIKTVILNVKHADKRSVWPNAKEIKLGEFLWRFSISDGETMQEIWPRIRGFL